VELKPNAAIRPAFLLTARREEDATGPDFSRDLWTTTNFLQESLMRGGLSAVNARGRRITTQPVKAVDADLNINRRLWELQNRWRCGTDPTNGRGLLTRLSFFSTACNAKTNAYFSSFYSGQTHDDLPHVRGRTRGARRDRLVYDDRSMP
jgi:hypothetical protein